MSIILLDNYQSINYSKITMEIRFVDIDLDRLEIDAKFTAGWSQEIVKAYRRRIYQIRAAADERDLYSARFEKLKGNRSHQYSIRLNDQYRLILEIEGKADDKTLVVVSIDDYH